MNGKHVKLDTLVDYHLRAYAGNGLRKLRLRTVLNMLGPLDGQLCLELVGDEALSYNLREAGSLLGVSVVQHGRIEGPSCDVDRDGWGPCLCGR